MIQRAAVMNTNESIATAKVRELSAEELRFTIKSSGKFSSTRELCGAKEFVGQERALAALELFEAVAKGQFPIYPVRTIDQGIEILTGIPAEGCVPGMESVSQAAARRLKELALRLKDFAAVGHNGGGGTGSNGKA